MRAAKVEPDETYTGVMMKVYAAVTTIIMHRPTTRRKQSSCTRRISRKEASSR